MPDFESWKHENLVALAKASYNLMREQKEEIHQLHLDRKTLLAAFRKEAVNARKED